MLIIFVLIFPIQRLYPVAKARDFTALFGFINVPPAVEDKHSGVYLGKDLMMDINTISELLKHHQADLRQHGVKSLAVFGSVARGEATSSSDMDVLLEFDRPVGLFEFIRLKYFLETLVSCSVDLVTPDAVRPSMRANILSESVYVA
jgi:predicted nucleotidyltransferase